MEFIDTAAPNLFFTGKGGVGKTSIASAVAVALADAGRSVLIVSTDPASNLDEVFGARLGLRPTPIPEIQRLSAMNVDPIAAAAAYRETVIGPYRQSLPAAVVAAMEEQLAGACTVEIAAFNAFARLIGDPSARKGFTHVVFDTAPTGHTLRLLALPAAWTGFIANSTAGTSCIGPLQGMIEQRDLYAGAVAALSDPERTAIILVARAENSALDEAARTSAELMKLGVGNQHLIVNGVFRASVSSDPIAGKIERQQAAALAEMPDGLRSLPRTEVRLKSSQLIGAEKLRRLFDDRDVSMDSSPPVSGILPGGIEAIIDDLAAQPNGLVMTMGKGGVGKTTIAADVATALAERGRRVLLTTTDPAAHVAGAVNAIHNDMKIDRIDPAAEVALYREEVMATTGAGLDEAGRLLLAEDLSTPCTEEIAVFRAFARSVAEAEDRIVVMDTAPTGHTILLLDAAQSYHREVSRQAKAVPEPVLKLLPRLRDRNYTRVLLCTLAEATPVHEAAMLQDDLRRAGIEPFAWIVNQSLAPVTVQDPILSARRAQELRYIAEITDRHATRVALVPWRGSAGSRGGR